MAPFAMALSADRRIARQLGNTRLPNCKWLQVDGTDPSTAAQWYPLLRYTADLMNRGLRLPLWKILLGLR